MKTKLKSVPQLRFPMGAGTFRRERLDAIVSKKISYGIVQAGDHVPDGTPYIKSQDLNGPLRLDGLQRTSTVIAKKYKRSEVAPGDIVFSLRGNIGVAQIVPASIPVSNLTQGTARISVQDHDNKYVCMALQTLDVVKQVQAFAKGSTFREISLDDLRKVTVAIPSLPEQRKIADFLTAVDRRIGQLSQKKALLETYKKGVMQQFFTQAIRFKDDHDHEFPDWEEKRAKEFFVLQRGFDLTKKQSEHGVFPVYSSSGISYYHDQFKVRGPSVVTGRKGSVGPVFYVNEDYWPHDTALWVKDFCGNSPIFVYYFLLWFDLSRFDEASSVPTLNRNNVHREVVSFPSFPEQAKIANFLRALDRKIESVAQQITHTQAFKKGLLQQMFV